MNVVLTAALASFLLQGTGSKSETRLWQGGTERLEPGACARVTATYVRSSETRGRLLTCGLGSSFAYDRMMDQSTQAIEYVVYNPPDNPRFDLKPYFGLYQVVGRVEVGDLGIDAIVPKDAPFEGRALGSGETLVGTDYWCDLRLGGASGNYHRSLRRMVNVQFKDDRWVFNGPGEIVLCHDVGQRRFLSANLKIGFHLFQRKSLEVSASKDGTNWLPVATVESESSCGTWKLPEGLFPADTLSLRLASSGKASFQLNAYAFSATVSGMSANAIGATSLGVRAPSVKECEYLREDYGFLLPTDDCKDVSFWTASSGWKIPRHRRTLPRRTTSAVRVSLAANEAEAVQVVAYARSPLAGVRIEAGELRSASGEKLPATAIEILRERYVPVTELVEPDRVRGLYPDPLPPQRGVGVDVPSGEQQPFWIRVTAPKNAKAGIYRGELKVTACGMNACSLPFEVTVFGFELPDALTCRTAFGAFRQRSQTLKLHRGTASNLRRLVDNYYDAMAAYHLSPYRPAELAGSWKCEVTKGHPLFDWTAWDAELSRAFARWPQFNTFRLRAELHLGTASSEGAQREAFDDSFLQEYLMAIDRHLTEKGWADKALIYTFDEPTQSSLDLVRRGLSQSKRFAPHLKTLLTSPEKEGLRDVVDIWCPIMSDFTPSTSNGWAYVCMYPHAPYATLFIEHPAVELRAWLWQAWMRGLKGVLVWDAMNVSDGKGGQRNPYVRTYEKPDHGNGDGLFIYPPESVYESGKDFVNERPVGSIRGEMLRDGLEDYEYLSILRRLDPTSPLLRVPSEIATSLDSFASTPEPIEDRRQTIARTIERLLGKE